MDGQPVVRVRGLRKRYGGVTAVDGIDFSVHRGEVFALLGPNGAGKTSTLEILAGFRRRDAGLVTVLGADPQHAGLGWRSRIGIVLQDAHDGGELTVAETVRHFARYYPDPGPPDALIERVGLGGKARARVRTLSGGQRRRLDVAVGLVGRPDLLFLDEPTTGFDPQARRQFWTLIRGLTAEGMTILLTSHHLDEVEALAHRMAVLVRGRIAAEGDVATFGGRTTGAATVSWLDGGRKHTEHAADPAACVAGLLRHFDGAVPGLTISRPSLEDIYLDLIGADQ